MATKMLPKSTRKALGRKGFKIGKYWYGYQNATSGTFRNEKRRFLYKENHSLGEWFKKA